MLPNTVANAPFFVVVFGLAGNLRHGPLRFDSRRIQFNPGSAAWFSAIT